MADTNIYKVEADSGLHRGLEIEAANYWPTGKVKAALLAGLIEQAVPCSADGHHLTLRSGRSKGWAVAIKCQDGQGRVIHPPTRGALRQVRQ